MKEHPVSVDVAVKSVGERDSLEQIISRINERLLDDFSESDGVLVGNHAQQVKKKCERMNGST